MDSYRDAGLWSFIMYHNKYDSPHLVMLLLGSIIRASNTALVRTNGR